ncbi:MAG: DMT family transporter [Planctomycetes bacterium]|nr:DMT family transporter [Planctomycetota bacterium]
MNPWLIVVMMVAGGAMMSFQAPINAALRTHVGVFESALVSFTVGTIALVLVVLLAGKGSVGAVRNAGAWQLLGGLIGAFFVTANLIAAPEIGVTRTNIASLAGTMTAAILIDRFGWVGIPAKPIEATRIAGVLLMVVSVVLINWKKTT